MGTINVPRAKIVELLGLSPDVDDAALEAALNKAIAQQQAKNADTVCARQQQQLEAEDRRLVTAAINDGKIGPDRREFWMGALKSSRADGRSLLASLTPVPAAVLGRKPTIDHEMEKTVAKITGRPVPVTASLDDPGVITVVREIAGRANTDHQVSQVTDEQLNAYIESDPDYHRAVWGIAKGAGGLAQPPTQYTVSEDYDPPWNPQPKLVVNNDGTGYWQNQHPDPETLGVRGGPKAAFNWPAPRDRKS